MNVSVLNTEEYNAWYAPYLATLTQEDLLDEFEISMHRFVKFVREIPIEKLDYSYSEGKWKIKDIILHLIDCERVLTYRALCIARGDKTDFPSFDEDSYVVEARAGLRSISSLLTEFLAVRQATICLFKSFSDEDLVRFGTSSGNKVSVRALGFIVIGHQNHHQKVFEERY